ncbi:MAG: two-component system, OmpR family, sensor histidine kinase SenX3 [Actinomycetota bacterium]|jgi:two-component system sensor histidine kinase SenX3|nr:two-component system, OmpR family, sensor histidine kinase SenX3 [Actinomycetota bacterium]
MTPVLVMFGLVGWVIAIFLGFRVARSRNELRRAREVSHAGENVALDEAIADSTRESAERVARAEAVQHWLLAALDEATDAIVVVDRIGREIVRNAPARRFGGARHGEVLAQDAVDELLHAALDGVTSQRELQLYGPPRQVLQLRSFPLRRDGEVVGAVAFTRDVSEARRVESVRRDFVANVSHELKTPIGALGLLAETMAATDDPSVIQQLADRVVREADRLSRIVDDLLDLSTIEAQESPSRAPIPVGLLVSETIDLVQAAADLADVPIRVSPEPPEIEIACDRRQMRSALMNLLDNAIKYSGPRQPVEIGAHLVGDRIALVVRDHGIGIPTRDLERIFERFYRVDRARSRDTGGTGLGLAIVRHVAQAHGGDVTVDSREGEGSTFTIQVPISNGGARPVSEAY